MEEIRRKWSVPHLIGEKKAFPPCFLIHSRVSSAGSISLAAIHSHLLLLELTRLRFVIALSLLLLATLLHNTPRHLPIVLYQSDRYNPHAQSEYVSQALTTQQIAHELWIVEDEDNSLENGGTGRPLEHSFDSLDMQAGESSLLEKKFASKVFDEFLGKLVI